MKQINAIARLTLKAAFRFRLFWAVLVVLLAAVIVLPLLIKDDGTARGFTQILLTYTLTLTAAILGFATLWLSCGTMARDIDEAQMQMLAVKPIPRWKIWMGKWLGINLLNLLLLAISGVCIVSLLFYRAHKLSPEQQAQLNEEVFVARASLRPTLPDMRAFIDQKSAEEAKKQHATTLEAQLEIRKQTILRAQAAVGIVPPAMRRPWDFKFGSLKDRLRDHPLFLRIKFYAVQTNESTSYNGVFLVGPPETPQVQQRQVNLAANTFHEIPMPPNLFDSSGNLHIEFANLSDSTLLFPVDEGIEILYREANFPVNFARGLGILFCWLALLAAIGLTSASFLSFPVAAFVSVGVLVVGLSSGTVNRVLEEGSVVAVNHETGRADSKTAIDYVMLPIFQGLSKVINFVESFSPVDSLSAGRSITWTQLGQAFAQIVIAIGGLIALVGIFLFNRRELATAQGTS